MKQFPARDGAIAVDYGFEILANVSQKNTAFSWIYDIASRTIRCKTAGGPQVSSSRIAAS